jgi:type I restriction enzyme S subunit
MNNMANGRWEVVTIAEIAKVKTGNNKLTKASYTESGYAAYSGSGNDGFCSHYEYDTDAIVVASVGARCGRGYLARGKWTAIANTTLIFPNPQKIDLNFLFQSIKDEGTWQRSGGAQPFVSVGEIEGKILRIPPLDEQKKIAEILTTVDKVIVNTEAEISKLEGLKKATMNELLTKGIGHTEFKETEIGRIPKRWNVELLDKLTDTNSRITYGVVQPGPAETNGVKFIRGGDIYRNQIEMHRLRTISAKVSREYNRTVLRGGELLMSLVGYPGEVAIVPNILSGANIARQVAMIRLTAGLHGRYFMHYLSSHKGKESLSLNTIGSAQQVINLVDLKAVRVAVPPLQEQEAISTVLDQIDEFVRRKTEKYMQWGMVKRSLMQDLLTGKVRVKVN